MNERICVLNCPIDNIDVNSALKRVCCAIENKKNFQIITINPEMIINAQKNKEFFNVINSADLIIPDGIGVKIALQLKGIKIHKIRGIDFSRELIKLSCKKGLKIGFLGAKEEIIQKAKENILNKYKNINIAYVHNGYFDNENKIIEEIRHSDVKILLVGMGSPYQEEFIRKLKQTLNGTVMIGVGGSFDVYSGTIKEAPIFYQKLGLEWMYRTILQPERFGRIFPLLPLFLIKCIINSTMSKD